MQHLEVLFLDVSDRGLNSTHLLYAFSNLMEVFMVCLIVWYALAGFLDDCDRRNAIAINQLLDFIV